MTSEHQATQFWERRYGEREHIWSGRVNQVLADVASGLTAGTALDLGAGEGADAIWLASHGWQVTAVDISDTALSRARSTAEQAGVADRISFQQADLAAGFPSGSFDLVTAHYLHAPADLEFPRAAVLQRAAAAVAPRGSLLIVDHGAMPPWAQQHLHQGEDGEWHEPPAMATLEETFDSLELDPERWQVERREATEREAGGPDGQTGTVLDHIILARRIA